MKNSFGIPDIDLEILHYIAHIKKAIDCTVMSSIGMDDLTQAQVELLARLHYGDVNTSTELASCLQVSKANLTGLISRLEKKELLKRATSKEDSRSKIIELTPKGKKLIEKVIPKMFQYFSKFMEEIPNEEKKIMEKNLHFILNKINK